MTALALILGSLVLLGPPAVGDSTPADALNERLSLNIDGGKPAEREPGSSSPVIWILPSPAP